MASNFFLTGICLLGVLSSLSLFFKGLIFCTKWGWWIRLPLVFVLGLLVFEIAKVNENAGSVIELASPLLFIWLAISLILTFFRKSLLLTKISRTMIPAAFLGGMLAFFYQMLLF